MSITVYDPDPAYVAGNSGLWIVTSIASLAAPKLTELNVAGTVKIDCAVESFGVSTDVSYVDRKMLCDTKTSKSIGSRSYAMDALTIMMGDPQGASNAVLTALPLDAIRYLVLRPGKAHATALAVGDKVQVVKVQVASVDLRPVSNAEGEEFAMIGNFAVMDVSVGLVAMVA